MGVALGSLLMGFVFKLPLLGAIARTLFEKLADRITLEDFGAVGDGVADDTAALNVAASKMRVVFGTSGKVYRTTAPVVIATSGSVIDLDGADLLADFDTGNAVTVGDGTVLARLGIRNGVIKTLRASTGLNGVIFKRNVRRNVQYGGLYVSGFKGIGVQFEELNWSIQAKEAPIIEGCGVNLDINDNGNAITIVGAGLYEAVSYNVRLRGTVGVTFLGGYNQGAGVAGAYLGTGTMTALQACISTAFIGMYWEDNGVSHIVGENGKGLNVTGNFLNGNSMTGSMIDLNGWTGAVITDNTPQNTGGRDFVTPDAASSLIKVGRQNVSTLTDLILGGSPDAYVSDAFPVPVSALPAPSLMNRGTMMLLAETGTAANSNRPYLCMDTASGVRAFRQLGMEHRKQGAVAGAATLTPDLSALDFWDVTLQAAGITINAPTGPFKDGQEIIFFFKQSAAPTAAVTWNAVFKTDLSTTLLANAYGSVTFRYSGGRSLWVQVAKLEWKV